MWVRDAPTPGVAARTGILLRMAPLRLRGANSRSRSWPRDKRCCGCAARREDTVNLVERAHDVSRRCKEIRLATDARSDGDRPA